MARERTVWTEIVDQALHLSVAVAVTWLLRHGIPTAAAVFIVMALAGLREFWQHRPVFEFGMGSVRDMFFFFVGAIVGANLPLIPR